MISVRHRPLRMLAWLLTCWTAAVFSVAAAVDLPASPAPRYVYDQAKWLGPAAFGALDSRLQAYERETSSQLVVAIFPSIPAGAEMVDFSQRVFEKWKPGTAGKDNGAILFIFAADRKLRIHTGYGLEGVLPDARCKQIIDEVMTPLLRAGQREQAVRAGVEAMIAATKGEYKGTGRTHGENPEKQIPLPVIIFIILLIIGLTKGWNSGDPDVILTRRGSRHGSWGGGWSSGGGGFSGGGGGGGFSGGGGSSGGGGASGGW